MMRLSNLNVIGPLICGSSLIWLLRKTQADAVDIGVESAVISPSSFTNVCF